MVKILCILLGYVVAASRNNPVQGAKLPFYCTIAVRNFVNQKGILLCQNEGKTSTSGKTDAGRDGISMIARPKGKHYITLFTAKPIMMSKSN